MFARMFGRIKERGSFGQSLVETALFLPLLIFLIAGVLELSNLLVTQNRVTSAARAGTRFAAANFGEEQWAAWNTYAGEVANVALNNVTETLELDPARWDMWVIKATIAVTTSTDERWFPSSAWNAVHVDDGDNYGVMPLAEWTAREAEIQQEILDALETVPNGTEIVATDAYHHRNAFLGLAPYNLGPFTRIRGLTVMRVDETVGTYGSCDTFPIAMSLYNNALWPSDYNDPENPKPADDEYYPLYDKDADPPIVLGPGFPYGNLSYQNENVYWPFKDIRGYEFFPTYTVNDKSDFPYNQPGRRLLEAEPGDIFLIKQVSENRPSAFGWLRWDASDGPNTPNLDESLAWPGNSFEYFYNDPPEYQWMSDDGRINRFDLLKVSNGATPAIREPMRQHVDYGFNGRLVRLVVFTPPDWVEPGTAYPPGDANGRYGGTEMDESRGQAITYEVYAFVLVRVVAWNLSNNLGNNGGSWLVIEFHGWDVECGPSPTPVPSPTPTTEPYP